MATLPHRCPVNSEYANLFSFLLNPLSALYFSTRHHPMFFWGISLFLSLAPKSNLCLSCHDTRWRRNNEHGNVNVVNSVTRGMYRNVGFRLWSPPAEGQRNSLDTCPPFKSIRDQNRVELDLSRTRTGSISVFLLIVMTMRTRPMWDGMAE